MYFALGDGAVLDAAGDDEDLALFQLNRPVAHLDLQTAFKNQEELVLFFVGMPDEVAFELGKFDLVLVDLGDGLRRPVFGDFAELSGEVDYVAVGLGHVLVAWGAQIRREESYCWNCRNRSSAHGSLEHR